MGFRTQDFAYDDGETLTPAELHNYLTRVMYNRRNKFDPLWNSLIIGGVKDGVPYLGSVRLPLGFRCTFWKVLDIVVIVVGLRCEV